MSRKMRQITAALLGLTLCWTFPLSVLASISTISCDALVLRKSASKESKALQTLSKGDTMDILSAEGSWYKVRYGKYTGYVMSEYVAVKASKSSEAESADTASDSNMKGISSIKDIGGAPATSAPGDSGSHVKKLQQVLKLLGYYTLAVDGKYGDGTTAAVKKFQKSKGMSQDGIDGKVTIKLLFGEEVADSQEDETIETEVPVWFKNGSSTIPKGATFEVMDCKTGKTFTVRRWSGSNHLDAEPLTAEDTATMKAIYGGSWS